MGLPVYEIYKAGEDVHVRKGLNFFADFGLSLSFIPWNNTDGGAELDTSAAILAEHALKNGALVCLGSLQSWG